MNDLQIFNSPEFGQIRTVTINGKIHFVAIDIAKALGYKDTTNAIKQHCRWVVKHHIPHPQNPKKSLEVNVIPEGDIYRLISNSELPNAERFESWIFDEVLPTMRKTGGYIIEGQEEKFIEIYFPTLSEETKKAMIIDLQRSIKAMKPKADYFDALVERNLLTNFRDTAKELHVKERKFIEWLQDNGYIYRDQKGKIKPYAEHVPALFELKEFVRNGFAHNQVLITPKGRETFRLLLQSRAEAKA